VFPPSAVFGLRPGYVYHVKIGGGVERPGLQLYPTLEVRGTLQLPPQQRAADYPAPVVFSLEDLDRAAAGALITKVIYLESAERARGAATRPDLPLETELRPAEDLLAEARSLGRPVLVAHLGGRNWNDAQLAAQAIPGTVLLPGDPALPPPAAGPSLPAPCFPVNDPYLGHRPPEEECLHDGGDTGWPAGLDAEGRLRGVDPSDTVAVYTDNHGGRHLAVSNRVCLCVPRFAVLRSELAPSGVQVAHILGGTAAAMGQSLMQARQPPREEKQSLAPGAILSRERASETQELITLAITEHVRGNVELVGRMAGQTIVGTLIKQAPPPPERPLVLQKWADRQSGQIGDLVTFYLRFSNRGGQPITDVAITDSLTGRLEYVPGSARSDRPATFTVEQNEAGSALLRWQISGQLLPGQSGLVQFQARIR